MSVTHTILLLDSSILEMDHNIIMRNSPEFKRLNSMCSRDSYLSDRLRNNDYEGFSSAGILVVGDEYELINEERDGISGLSIPGGKRDYIGEDPISTALREYNEEGGSRNLKRGDLNRVLWYARGKYALFIVGEGSPPIPRNTHVFSKLLLESYLSKIGI